MSPPKPKKKSDDSDALSNDGFLASVVDNFIDCADDNDEDEDEGELDTPIDVLRYKGDYNKHLRDVFDRTCYTIDEPVKITIDLRKKEIKKPYLVTAPEKIEDKFSLVLGDAFHFMDRAQVPVHHEVKKAYFMALSRAFLMFDPILLTEVKIKFKKENPRMSDDDVDNYLYFHQTWLCSIVPRTVPPPSVLYWRVRVVYALYGNQLSSQGVPLFNDAAWAKANNVLQEILKGHASDPPGMSFYTQRVNRLGQPLYDKLGFALLNCCRGTNATECVHKQITTTFHFYL